METTMRRLLTAVALALTSFALAQDAPPQAVPYGPQGAINEGRRDEFINRIFSRVADELDLDANQRAVFDDLAAVQKKQKTERAQRFMETRMAQAKSDQTGPAGWRRGPAPRQRS